MKSRWLKIFFLLCIFYSSQALCELRGILEPHEKGEAIWNVGAPKVVSLTVWPQSAFDFESFKRQTETAGLFDLFYVQDLMNRGPSNNNIDALILEMTLIPTKTFDPFISYFYSDDKNSIKFEFKGISKSQGTANEVKALSFLSHSLPFYWSFQTKVVLLVVFLVVSILITFFIKKRKAKQKLKRKKEAQIKELIALLSEAKKREVFEKIYLRKDEYVSHFKSSREDIETLCGKIEKIQYKQTWTEEEIEELMQLQRKLLGGISGFTT